jgi:hypothetical protein
VLFEKTGLSCVQMDWASQAIAKRVAGAFQHVGWQNEVGSNINAVWADTQRTTDTYDAAPNWNRVYKFLGSET